MAHQQNNNNESVYDWMRSNRIYEEYLFKYVIILVFIGAIGFFTFGFELQGLSLQYSLLANFVYFIVLAIAMAFTPLWYKLLFNRGSQRKKRIDIIKLYLDNIEDIEQRQAIQQHLAKNGELPPRKAQRWALIFLGWCFLFEMFFVSSWVKDMALVWQPDWVIALVQWGQENTMLLSVDIAERENRFFVLSDGNLPSGFETDKELLYSSFGKVAVLFQIWKTVTFLPISFAYSILLWQMVDWLGVNYLNPKNIKSFGRFIYFSAITLFLTLLVLIMSDMSCTSISTHMFSTINKAMWLDNFYINFGFVFISFCLKIYVGWYDFWKHLISKLYRKFV